MRVRSAVDIARKTLCKFIAEKPTTFVDYSAEKCGLLQRWHIVRTKKDRILRPQATALTLRLVTILRLDKWLYGHVPSSLYRERGYNTRTWVIRGKNSVISLR